MRNLLFINQTQAFGGAEVFDTDLLTWLQQTQNFSVTAYVTQPQFQKVLTQNNVLTHSITTTVDLIGDWKGFLKGVILIPILLVKYLSVLNEHKNIDIIFMSGFIEKIFITPMAKLFHLPVVWLEFAPLEPIFKKFWGFPRLLYALVENLPYRVVVPSQNTARHLLQTTHISASRLVVIPLGRNISQITKSPASPGLVVCVSRLEPGKGQDYLLRAWATVQKLCPQARLRIIGGGDFYTTLSDLSRQLNLGKTVTFLGELPNPEVLNLVSASEICVFPTLWPLEGFGLVSIEAMAVGIPVVGFNFGPLPEIVTPDTGILVPPGDIPALARALVKLLGSRSLRAELGSAGKRRYDNNYSFAKIGSKYVELFTAAHQSV